MGLRTVQAHPAAKVSSSCHSSITHVRLQRYCAKLQFWRLERLKPGHSRASVQALATSGGHCQRRHKTAVQYTIVRFLAQAPGRNHSGSGKQHLWRRAVLAGSAALVLLRRTLSRVLAGSAALVLLRRTLSRVLAGRAVLLLLRRLPWILTRSATVLLRRRLARILARGATMLGSVATRGLARVAGWRAAVGLARVAAGRAARLPCGIDGSDMLSWPCCSTALQ